MFSSSDGNCIALKKPGICSAFFLPALFVVMLFAAAFQANAQNFFPEQRDYGIAVGIDYDMPRRNLSADYKSGLNYNASFLKYGDVFTFGGTVAFRQFSPKMGTVKEVFDDGNIAISKTSALSTFAIYGTGVYNIPMGQQNKLYLGANLGVYDSYSSFTYQDEYYSYSQKNIEEELYFAPKLGLICSLNDDWDIDFHAAYNFFTKGISANYNTISGGGTVRYPLYSSITAGIALVYKF